MTACSEYWREIPGFEGFYEVSSCGRVRSVNRVVTNSCGSKQSRTGKILSAYDRGSGYLVVTLSRDGATKLYFIHRLVLLAFEGPCPVDFEACHCDGNSKNNRLENLRWDSRLHNVSDKVKHGTAVRGTKVHSAKLTEGDVRSIRAMRGQMGAKEIGAMFGVGATTVTAIHTRQNWAYLD